MFLLNGVMVGRGRTVAIVVQRVGDVNGGSSIEVGDLDSLLGANGGDGGNICFSARSSLVLAGPLVARSRLRGCSGLCLMPGSTKDSPPWE